MARETRKTYIPLRDRLILNFLFFGVVIILIIGAFSYYTARDILLDRTFDQLTSVKVVKKRQIENFFADRSRDLKMILASEDAGAMMNILFDNQLGREEKAELITEVYSTYLDRYLHTQSYYNTLYITDINGISLEMSIADFGDGEALTFGSMDDFLLSGMWNSVIESKDIVIRDLNKESPSPGLFMGGPLIYNNVFIGMIVMEISVDAINTIMYENNPSVGLGESGESYLVGEDLLMRSRSRFQDNSILNTEVASIGVRLAMEGHDSTAIIDDYRGIEVLSSFSRVDISKLNWVILTEIDLKEALISLSAIRNNIMLISSVIVLALFLAAVFLSARMTSPLVRLTKAAKKIGQGDFDTDLRPGLANEIGDLMNSFIFMTDSLSEKTNELRAERLKQLRSVIDGQELERQRLSRELHDGLGQRIIALKLRLEDIKSADQCETMRKVKEVKDSVDDTIDEVRRMSNDLMPAVLYEFGIATALRNLLESVSESSKIKSKFSTEGKVEELDKTTKIYLYRIAQEALNNVVKHAEANRIHLQLIRDNDFLCLCIEDDGIGFDASIATGNGLHNMRERANLLQGRIDIETIPGNGTKVKIEIPLIAQNI